MRPKRINKILIDPNRRRSITSGFAFIPHSFLLDGYLSSLSKDETVLYLFLVLASDKDGLSFYSYQKICSILRMDLDRYINARNALIQKDLIAFDGCLFQVLTLPNEQTINNQTNQKHLLEKENDPATVQQMCRQSLNQND